VAVSAKLEKSRRQTSSVVCETRSCAKRRGSWACARREVNFLDYCDGDLDRVNVTEAVKPLHGRHFHDVEGRAGFQLRGSADTWLEGIGSSTRISSQQDTVTQRNPGQFGLQLRLCSTGKKKCGITLVRGTPMQQPTISQSFGRDHQDWCAWDQISTKKKPAEGWPK
jgi:hypothetical protein